MREKLATLKLPPGVFRNGTKYQAKGRWIDSNLMRWIDPQTLAPIGGWLQIGSHDLTGIPRASHAWRGNDRTAWLAVGTTGPTSKAYVLSDNTLTDITPAGLVNGAQDGSYSSGDYGEGGYGNGNFGTGSGAVTLDEADTWQFDNFGDFLLGCLTSDGKIYYWDRQVANDFVQASGSPTSCAAVVVTPERFIFALGASGVARRVKWPIQEGGLTVSADWTPTGSNSAGDFDLATRGGLIAGRASRRQTLLWTDVDLHVATYIGGTLIYSFEQIGDNCGLIGPNAVAMVGGTAFWMSHGRFYLYDGAVKPIECEVQDYVFGHLNTAQRAKIAAVPNTQFDEVTWYYPSTEQAGQTLPLENDRYVTYNYRYGIWMLGSLRRSTGVDRGVFEFPILLDDNGQFFDHERGQERSLSVTIDIGPPVVRNVNYAVPYIESGPMEVGDGDQRSRVLHVVPDENTLGDVNVAFYTRDYPTSTDVLRGPYTFSQQPVSVRFDTREARMRLSEATQGQNKGWRVGTMRLGIVPSGRR